MVIKAVICFFHYTVLHWVLLVAAAGYKTPPETGFALVSHSTGRCALARW